MKLGIEVEVENLPNPVPYPNSVIKPDGSLRNNGIEYVSEVLDNELTAKQWYSGLLAQLNAAEADFNKRCGVHIHMNFRGTNKGVRQAFLLKYLVVERHLLSLIPQRRGSNFCLPLLDYDGDLDNFRKYFSDLEGTRSCHYMSKYSALNLKPLMTLGTMEFRALPSLSTPELFNQVLDILVFIRKKTINQIIAKYNIPMRDVLEAKAFMRVITAQRDTSSMEFLDSHFKAPKRPVSGITEEDLLRYLTGN